MSVKLVIKSGTQTVEDFNLDCELTWTIGQVKSEIAELYPTKPNKETQKLIYGGKLLPDHLPLKSVLNHNNERHIVHLVCPLTPTDSETEPKQATSTQSFTVPPSSDAFSPINQPVFNSQNLSDVSGINVTPLNTGDALQQYLAMQQMYTQIMTQYMSQYNGGVPPVLPYGPMMPTPTVQMPQVPAPQQTVARNPPQRPADDDHDYLDYLYVVSRAALLFALLYYYSSLSRVLIVVTMFLFISMYVKLNRRNQQIQHRINEAQRNESAATQPVPADIQPSEGEEMPATNPPASEEGSSSQQTENRSLSTMLGTTVNLITTFFSSLIPSEPVPVNVN